jgi:histidinol-phosphate aminotransferase
MTFFRNNIARMTGYVPGEQPSAGQKVIKLNTNENPYPPSPAAMRVLRSFDGELLRRYSHPTARAFREAAARVLDVPADWVLPGNGSDDLLTMIFRACTEPGRKAAYPMPTYTLYRTLAEIQAAEVAEVPFDEDFRLPVDGLAEAKAAVTLVAHPNAPSGTAVPRDRLEELARRAAGLVVIDEAYVDFADYHVLDLARSHENVIVLRSLSKGYSLAGLRLGFAVANPAILDGLIKVKDSYNVGAVPCAVAAAAFEDRPYRDRCVERVRSSRARLAGELEGMAFRVWPSQANFLLVRPPDGKARDIYECLKERGILIRYFNRPALEDKLRITVGTDEQNAALVRAIGEVLDAGAGE